MNSPLQSANLTADELPASLSTSQEAGYDVQEEESHIHMPNPSLWPLFVGLSVLIAVGGVMFIETNPWITIIGSVLVLFTMMGWVFENPMAPRTASGEEVYRPSTFAEAVLLKAEDVVDRTVTISSTAWSAHPVKVELEREGVVLGLYGQVELEEQKRSVEAELLKLPGVIDVKNFIVAEDALLNAINNRIESLKAAGKLDGARDISVLVENYIANLYGEVPNSEMKYMLERELVGIPGVRVVVNRIGLADIPGNLGKTRNK